MNTLLFLIIVLVVIVGSVAVIGLLARPKTGPTRRERELENAMEEIRELAYQYRDTDSGLSYAITDKIAEYHRKELL